MNWQRATAADWHQLSADGRYSVVRINLKDGAVYEAWRTRAHADGPGCIEISPRRFAVRLPTSAEARRICEEDDRGAA